MFEDRGHYVILPDLKLLGLNNFLPQPTTQSELSTNYPPTPSPLPGLTGLGRILRSAADYFL